MKMNKEKSSLMQIEVWRMKNKVYKDTKGMRSVAFFRYVDTKSRKVIVK